MRAILGYGVSIIRGSQEYEDLLEHYPWLSVSSDEYLSPDDIIRDAIEEDLEVTTWSCRDLKDGILIAARGTLFEIDETSYGDGTIADNLEVGDRDNDIWAFCEIIGREPEWVLLCIE